MNEQEAMDAARAEAANSGSAIESISAAAGVPLAQLREKLSEMLAKGGTGGVSIFVPSETQEQSMVHVAANLRPADLKIIAARVAFAFECFSENIIRILENEGIKPATVRQEIGHDDVRTTAIKASRIRKRAVVMRLVNGTGVELVRGADAGGRSKGRTLVLDKLGFEFEV